MVAKLKSGHDARGSLPAPASSPCSRRTTCSAAGRPASCPRPLVNAAFATPKGVPGSVDGEKPTERYVFEVTGMTEPKLDDNAAEDKAITATLQNSIADDISSEYLGHVESTLGIDINQSAVEPGHRRRQPLARAPMQIEPSEQRLRREIRARRAAGRMDDAGCRSGDAGLGLSEALRRQADELPAGIGGRRRGARALFDHRPGAGPDLARQRRQGRDQPQCARQASTPSRRSTSSRSPRCMR